MNLTLGYSPCPNDTFIFHALVHGLVGNAKIQWNVHLEDVESLNRGVLQAELDVSKLSFHAYSRVWRDYQLLDAGSALGFGCGPLFIVHPDKQHLPLESLAVALPGEWTTAHFLFKLAFPQVALKCYLIFSEIEDAILNGEVDGGVIIHENRFTYQQKGLILKQDLGAYWESLTGLPIPLGGIAIRRSLSEEVKLAINHALADSVAYAFAHPEASKTYIAQHAQEMDAGVCQQHISLYVNAFTENLGIQGRDAIQRFYQEAYARRIIQELPENMFLQS